MSMMFKTLFLIFFHNNFYRDIIYLQQNAEFYEL